MQIWHYHQEIQSSFEQINIILTNGNVLVPRNLLLRKMAHFHKINTNYIFVKKNVHPQIYNDILTRSLQLGFPVKIECSIQPQLKKKKSGLPEVVIRFFKLLQKLNLNMDELGETCKTINNLIGQFSEFSENKVLLALGVYHLLRSQGKFNPEFSYNFPDPTESSDKSGMAVPIFASNEPSLVSTSTVSETATNTVNNTETVNNTATVDNTENVNDTVTVDNTETVDNTNTETVANSVTVPSETVNAINDANIVCPSVAYQMAEMQQTLEEIPLNNSDEAAVSEVSTNIANILLSLTY
jgi:hypothetical protein